ncbi:Lcl domain-containing protein [Haliea atlantica]
MSKLLPFGAQAFLLVLFITLPALAQETQPGDPCNPGEAHLMRHAAGPENPGTGYMLVCDGATWNAINEWDTATGNSLFQVDYDAGGCDGTKEGRIRFLSTGDPPWEYCDGASWVNFKQPRCQDDDTGECYLQATRSNDDPEFIADNIADGVNILGVTGTYTPKISVAGAISNQDLTNPDSVTVAGDYAYIASENATLTIIDLTDKTNPSQVGSLDTQPYVADYAKGVAVAGNYAYVTKSQQDELVIIDITNPASPSEVGSISGADLDGADGLALSGDYAYIASFMADGITVIDVSDPESPTQMGAVSSTDMDAARGVAVAGNYAYVASASADSLTVIDVSDPTNPTQVGVFSSGDLEGAWDVEVVGDYAYIASFQGRSLTIIDISNPANPVKAGSLTNTDFRPYGVDVAGNYAYLSADYNDRFVVIDISDPTNPIQIDALTSSEIDDLWDVEVAGGYAFVVSKNPGNTLSIIDLAGTYKVAEYFDCTDDNLDICVLPQNRSKYDTQFKPENIADGVNILGVSGTYSPSLSQMGSVSSVNLDGASDVAVAGDYAYVASYNSEKLTVIDISNPAAPVTVISLASAYLGSAWMVDVAGDYAYVTGYGSDRLTVIDISNPASPVEVGFASLFTQPRGVSISGDYAYVTLSGFMGSDNSVQVIDISDPANPSIVGGILSGTLNGAFGIDTAGDYVYVAADDSLVVIDVSNPLSPTEVGSVSSVNLDNAYDVAVAGEYAYVASYNSDQVTVIDISNPAAPVEVASITGANLDGAGSITVAGDYAYVASRDSDGLTVIDISNPASPIEVDAFTSVNIDGAYDVAVAGDYAYVVGRNSDSLTVIDLAGTYKVAEYFDCTNDNLDTCVLPQNRSRYDAEFKPQNIADGVNILGVTGTFTGGNTTPPTNCPNIGDTCDDGSIYAGLTPDGDVKMYTTATDAPSTYTWNDGTTNYTDMSMTNCTDTSPGTAATCQTGEANTAFLVGATGEPDYPFAAAEYCDGLSAHGHDDWYLPAQDELNVLYTNKNTGALNSTFNESSGWYYWSSSEQSVNFVRIQGFSDGYQGYINKNSAYNLVRCVRR